VLHAILSAILLLLLFSLGFMKAASALEIEDLELIEVIAPIEELTPVTTMPTDFDFGYDELSPLYSEILRELGLTYESIGARQARQVLDRQNGFYLGGFNNVGYRYTHRFGTFDINVERQLAPDLFDDERWIITDRFHIDIDASHLISKLRDDGLIKLNESQHALFAGVQFRRTYRYVHFADSYQEGLVVNLNKLFMSFKILRNKGYLDLAPYEILQREDYISANVGGMVVAPITIGLGATAGAMGRWHQLSKLEIQAVGPEDQASEGERLRINFEKTRGLMAGVHVGVHAEFLKLLRLTLLSYDFSYSLEQAQKTYLSFNESALPLLNGESELSRGVSAILKGRAAQYLDVMAPYIVTHEQRELEKKNSKYMVLLYGGHKEQATEYIELLQEGHRTSYFRHQFEKLKYVENAASRLIATLLRSSLQLTALVNHEQADAKRLKIEYRSHRNLLDFHDNLHLADNQNHVLSLHFNRDFSSQTFKRNKTQSKLQDLLATFSGVDPLIHTMVDQGLITGHTRLKVDTTVGEGGVRHLNRMSGQRAISLINELCQAKPRTLFERFRSLFGGCRHKLTKAYDQYWRELHHRAITMQDYKQCQGRVRFTFSARKRQAMLQKCIELVSKRDDEELNYIPLWRLSQLSQSLHDESDNKIDLFHFFGLDNVFLHGTFSAQTQFGPFRADFNEGLFRSISAVDGHMRASRTQRAPASLVID
jgi:hypothetical protein